MSKALILTNGVPIHQVIPEPPLATSSTDGLLAAADKIKLDAIQSGATLNALDAQLRDRSTHTGTQTSSTISDFNSSVNALITALRGAINGLAPLDSSGKIPAANIPAIALTDTFVVNSQAAMLALTAQTGDVAIRTDVNKTFVLQGSNSATLGDWTELLNPGNTAVQTVNSKTGPNIVLTTSDISEGTNLYYTQARFDSAFAAKTTTGLTEGTNLYYTNVRADARITAARGAANGIASLDASTKVPVAQLPTAAATSLSATTTNTEGASTSVARADHTHAIPSAVAVGLSTATTNTAGTSTSFARADHTHAVPSAVPVSTGSANAQGTSTSFARADHVHNVSLQNYEAAASNATTTTSTTDVALNLMSVTPIAGTYLVTFSGVVATNTNLATVTTSIYSGGAQVVGTERDSMPKVTNQDPVTRTMNQYANCIVTVNGSQAVEVRWRTSAGTATANSRILNLVRIG